MKSILKTIKDKFSKNKTIKDKFIKEDALELPVEKYEKIVNINTKDIFEMINVNIRNNSKDLYELPDFNAQALNLWELSEQTTRPLLVTVMGEFKTGKSTFINAILEEEILNSDVTPATAVVSMVSYGEERRIKAHFRDGRTKDFSFDELKDITAEGDDNKKELRNSIEYVELFVPKEILKKITIVDTPGLNVDNQLHIQATKEFMNKADMVFWIFAYGKAASRTEVAAISELSKHLKPIAIVNRVDEIDEEEESLEKVIEEIEKRLKDSVDEIIGVSAYLAKKGILELDHQALRESRWDNFTDKLEKKVVQKSEILKIKSILDKLSEYTIELTKYSKEKKSEVIKLESKVYDTVQYRDKIINDIDCLKALLEECVNMGKNREKIAVDYEYLNNCFGSGEHTDELNNIYIPINYLIKIIETLENWDGTERVIDNIQSYNEICDNFIEKLQTNGIRYEQLEKEGDHHNEEADKFKAQVNAYEHSGFFGGRPIFDVSGEGDRLARWRLDLDERYSKLEGKFQENRKEFQRLFRIITRLNSEIYDYLPKIKNIFEINLKKFEDELQNFEKDIENEKQRYSVLKEELVVADNVIDNLEALNEEGTEFLYKKAIAEGNTEAYAKLGNLFEKNGNYEGAIKHYLICSESGDSDAMTRLGDMYEEGKGVPQSYETAAGWYEKAAELGDSAAMTNLGNMYAEGNGVLQSYETAKQWYEKATELGEGTAMNNLGFMYAEGNDVLQSYETAAGWYEKAAELGNSAAMYNLGDMYEEGKGLPQSYETAAGWYEKAAEIGNSTAMNNLGWMYEKGNGVPQSYEAAAGWYEKAAELGDSDAMKNLGDMYEEGKGLPQSYETAAGWYEKAAEIGNSTAMNNLGWMYEKGNGVPQSYEAAKQWYENAAELGNSTAMNNLGFMYAEGNGVPRSYEAAKQWYEKAAELGNSTAMKNLGWMYKKGNGVPQSYEAAERWYEKAGGIR